MQKRSFRIGEGSFSTVKKAQIPICRYFVLVHLYKFKLLPHGLQTFGHGTVRLITEHLCNFLLRFTVSRMMKIVRSSSDSIARNPLRNSIVNSFSRKFLSSACCPFREGASAMTAQKLFRLGINLKLCGRTIDKKSSKKALTPKQKLRCECFLVNILPDFFNFAHRSS